MILTLSNLIAHLSYLQRLGISPNAPLIFFTDEGQVPNIELHCAGHTVLEQNGWEKPGCGDFKLHDDIQVTR